MSERIRGRIVKERNRPSLAVGSGDAAEPPSVEDMLRWLAEHCEYLDLRFEHSETGGWRLTGETQQGDWFEHGVGFEPLRTATTAAYSEARWQLGVTNG